MTAIDYDACETRVLAHEGGYTNDPQDPGGPTNWGITLADARAHWKGDASAADVRAMPITVAKSIYRAKYWNALRCDDLPPGVDDSVFDYGVNSGIGRAGKVLRRVIGQPDTDWHVTDGVLNSVKARDAKAIVVAIDDERLRFLQNLSTWPHFGGGWGRRVAEVRAFSLQLAGGSIPLTPRPDPKIQGAGKGKVMPPKTGPMVAGGGAAAAASGGLAHWIGAHPVLSFAIAAAGMALLIYIVGRLKQSNQAKQEAPTPGLVPVPVTQGSSS